MVDQDVAPVDARPDGVDAVHLLAVHEPARRAGGPVVRDREAVPIVRAPREDGDGGSERGVVAERAPEEVGALVPGVEHAVRDQEVEDDERLGVERADGRVAEARVGFGVDHRVAEGLAGRAEDLAGDVGLAGELLAGHGVEADEAPGGEVVHDHDPLGVVERGERPRVVAEREGEGRLAGQGVDAARADLEPAIGGRHQPVARDVPSVAEGEPASARRVGAPPVPEIVPDEVVARVFLCRGGAGGEETDQDGGAGKSDGFSCVLPPG